MGYREDWFKQNKGIKIPFKRGLWYKCVNCKQYFHKSDIDIDHIIPQSKGGTDAIWNLQPMCKHCNRSKKNNTNGIGSDLAVNIGKNIIKKLLK